MSELAILETDIEKAKEKGGIAWKRFYVGAEGVVRRVVAIAYLEDGGEKYNAYTVRTPEARKATPPNPATWPRTWHNLEDMYGEIKPPLINEEDFVKAALEITSKAIQNEQPGIEEGNKE